MTTTHRIATGIVATLALATAAPASATPWNPNSRDPVVRIRPAPELAMVAPVPVYSRPDKSLIPASTPYGDSATRAPQAIVRVETPKSGFDWGDAGIGAAGGFALCMVGLGGALAISQNRARRTAA